MFFVSPVAGRLCGLGMPFAACLRMLVVPAWTFGGALSEAFGVLAEAWRVFSWRLGVVLLAAPVGWEAS